MKKTTVRTIARLGYIWIFRYRQTHYALKESQKGNYEPSYQALRDYSIQVNRAAGARVIYHGLENLPEEPGVLFVSNHQSYFDIPIIAAVMVTPTTFIARNTLGKVPALATWMKMIDAIFLDRDDVRQALKCMQQAGERLKKGQNVVIFPEGTRSRSDDHGEFKLGSLKPAFIAKTAVVPVCIDGSHALFESNEGFHVVPREVHCYIGKPIDVSQMKRADQKELQRNMEDIVFNLKNLIP